MKLIDQLQVIQIKFDNAVSFVFCDGSELRIEGDFEIAINGHQLIVDSSKMPDSGNTILKFLTHECSAETSEQGSVILRSNSYWLKCSPDRDFEAWNFSNNNGKKVTCMPGGELAIWNPSSD